MRGRSGWGTRARLGIRVGTETHSVAHRLEFATAECQGCRAFGSLGAGQGWGEMQSRTDLAIPLLDVNAEWTEERDSRAPRGAQVARSSFPRWRQHLQQ